MTNEERRDAGLAYIAEDVYKRQAVYMDDYKNTKMLKGSKK